MKILKNFRGGNEPIRGAKLPERCVGAGENSSRFSFLEGMMMTRTAARLALRSRSRAAAQCARALSMASVDSKSRVYGGLRDQDRIFTNLYGA